MFKTGISVSCEVAKGIFMSEYFVKIQMRDGGIWKGAVDKETVLDLQGDPAKEYVKGRIYAYLISFNNESALIELPVEDSSDGRRIFVPVNIVRKERVPA